MIKSELITAICKKQPHLSESDVSLCINTIFDKIVDHLGHGGRVEIRNFGNFAVRYHKPRTSHNPKTGKKFMTNPKHVDANCAMSDGKRLSDEKLAELQKHAWDHGWVYPWGE